MHVDDHALTGVQLYEAALAVDPELEEAAAAVAQQQAESHAPPPALVDQQVTVMHVVFC